ncbi:hypothetical protein [Actinophytocola sp.]|uniref:hypothetical protein n=1 Tax=Actinophytocola sp. TaxID=1872138 RepID=UPI003899CD91
MPRVELIALENAQLDAAEITANTDLLLHHLEHDHSVDELTPGGISWLRVHAVPVRRLVTQVVKKLLALSSWAPFATSPGPIVTSVDGAPVEVRDSEVLGYHAYTVSWIGIAFLLAGSSDTQELGNAAEPTAASETTDTVAGLDATQTDLVAVSWSSRHAETLLPVLAKLCADGVNSLVVDLATEPDQRFPGVPTSGLTIRRVPPETFARVGGLHASTVGAQRPGRVLQVGACRIHLGRLALLAARLVEQSTDCTQPSWAAVCQLELLLDGVFAAAKPSVLLCSNDTSPVGVLTVGAADRAGVDTVYVQHGAWVSGQVTGRAEYCRHIAVMGTRDVAVARQWARRADVEVHVVGQPRFDALAGIDRESHRQYLRELFTANHGRVPEHMVVWACQPVSTTRLCRQFDVLVGGLRQATGEWGLVIAPHPAQSEAALASLLVNAADCLIALASSDVGARGCAGGAHAVASASSTCGIEALLLNVPVLELALPGSRTLELADQHAARRCTSSEEIAGALDEVATDGTSLAIPDVVKDAVCRSTGSAADAVAEIVAACITNHANGGHRPQVSATTFAPEREDHDDHAGR